MRAFIDPGFVLIAAFVLVLLHFVRNKGVPEIRAHNLTTNSPTHSTPADQQPPPANNSPTPAGRKINWFGWTKRRWFWWPVLALAAAIAVFFAWQHLPPTSLPIVGAWGTSGNQSDAVSWWDWFFQSTETGIPGIPRWLLAVAGLLALAWLLLPSTDKPKHGKEG